jgi:hypothetical protein
VLANKKNQNLVDLEEEKSVQIMFSGDETVHNELVLDVAIEIKVVRVTVEADPVLNIVLPKELVVIYFGILQEVVWRAIFFYPHFE